MQTPSRIIFAVIITILFSAGAGVAEKTSNDSTVDSNCAIKIPEQGSEYNPVIKGNAGGITQEVVVTLPGQAGHYSLQIIHNGKILKTIALSGSDRIDIPLLYNGEEIRLMDGEKILATKKLAVDEVFAGFEVKATPSINPVDLGRVLIPADVVAARAGQELKIGLWFCPPKQELNIEVTANARILDLSGEVLASQVLKRKIVDSEVWAANELKISTAGLKEGEYSLELSFEKEGRSVYTSKRRLIICAAPAAGREFGAYYTDLKYDAPIRIHRNQREEKWNETSWEDIWQRGPHRDIVVAFPDGKRYVFWRGSSYAPFWYSNENVGMCYEWMETGFERGENLLDCVEPLQDKECRYSRTEIVSSTAARAVVDWRYAEADFNYKICNNEWVDETYTFYPDGFGVRKIRGSIRTSQPGDWHETCEFLVLAPNGVRPYEVLPKDIVRFLSVEEGRECILSFPNPEIQDYTRPLIDNAYSYKMVTEKPEWPKDVPTLMRVKYHKNDESTPFSVCGNVSKFRIFAGMKEEGGRYACPVCYCIHFPVTRGLRTWRRLAPGMLNYPGSYSIMTYACEPLSEKAIDKDLSIVTWAWLIGNTKMSDDELRRVAYSWVKPAGVKAVQGAKEILYDKCERGYIVKCDKNKIVEMRFEGDGTRKVFNPVFILENYSCGEVKVTVNDKPAGSYRAGIEQSYTQDKLVVWTGQEIADNSVIRIEPQKK
jgi:hypothetical protein